ncbi:membrane protein [Faecalicoccus pleomorphus]|uniref:Membrane protein n=1 Tax=Faecalicoccus pleomorphus TaxID=1323 RepID=A0A380LK08_9FIRM|nr:DUF2304 domain-containing protein [Faecalicoccus pleomorphus]SUO04158.1 membrane protein [Faecalicoccus pleomorphus]
MQLSIVFLITSFFTFIFIILKIRKNGLNIDDSIIWIIWGILLLILSLFPQIPTYISDILGFMSTSNFIFSIFIFFLYILLFVQSIQISKLKEKQKELIQKLSLKEKNERDSKK